MWSTIFFIVVHFLLCPEFGLSHPMFIQNVVYNLPNFTQIVLKNEVVAGFSDCNITKLGTRKNIKTYSDFYNLTCRLSVSGTFIAQMPESVVYSLKGEQISKNVITREGDIIVSLVTLKMFLELPFYFRRDEKNNILGVQMEGIKRLTYSYNTERLNITVLNRNDVEHDNLITEQMQLQIRQLNLVAPAIKKFIPFFNAYLYNFISKIPIADFFSDGPIHV